MPKNDMKRLTLPLVILVVLVIIALVATDPFGLKKKPTDVPGENEPERITICDFTADEISKIEFKKPGEETAYLLEKVADEWSLMHEERKYVANTDRIDRMLAELPGLKTTGLVSDKTEKHETFEVNDSKAIELKLYTSSEEPTVTMLVGKATAKMDGTFVRINGDDKVFSSSKNIKSLFGFSFDDYRTRTPWEFDTQNATAVSIAPPTGGESIAFSRETGVWQYGEGKNANQNLIAEVLDAVSKLRVSTFQDQESVEVTGLTEEILPSVIITTPNGEITLFKGNKKDSAYYVSDKDRNVYLVSEYNLKKYLEMDFDLLTFDDTAVEELSPEMEPDEGIDNGLKSDAEE